MKDGNYERQTKRERERERIMKDGSYERERERERERFRSNKRYFAILFRNVCLAFI